MKRENNIMSLKNVCTTTVLGICLLASFAGNASVNSQKHGTCSQAAIERANKLFGPGAGEKTTCVQRRDQLKTIIAWNSDTIHPSKNGLQVLNARNVLNDWESSYDLKINNNFDAIIVAYGKGARWAVNNAAYKRKFGSDNPSIKEVKSLLKRGVKVYMCQNSMKGAGFKPADLVEGIEMVPSGVTALIDFQYQGFKYLAP